MSKFLSSISSILLFVVIILDRTSECALNVFILQSIFTANVYQEA